MTRLALSNADKTGLAVWENEGGSRAMPDPLAIPTPAWPPASLVMSAIAEARGADQGISDTHTIAIMRGSLIPVLAGIAMLWGGLAD
ncbi:MAG: hypothetical protein ABL889_22400 [Terricaulis sp.]